MDGVLYTCARNIIINGTSGSGDESTVCLEKETGEVLWTNDNSFAITPNKTKAAHDNKLYLIAGTIGQPKQLVAVDIETGDNLYYSEELPGDADQEGPIAINPVGIIFFHRDGGDLFAVKDNGNEFNILWTYTPISMSLFIFNFGTDLEGNLLVLDNGRLFRLNQNNGIKMDSTQVSNISTGRISISADSVIYVNNTSGAYYAFSYDLQTILWTIPNMNGNYYAGPALCKEGVMVVCGSGTTIRAFQVSGYHAPVADFAVSAYHILTGQTIDFTDQSSFDPDSWYWEFPGGDPDYSTEQSPHDIFYNEPGIYSVSLVAVNPFGADTLIKHCLIEVDLNTVIHTPNLTDAFSFYPNPAGSYVLLTSLRPGSICIYNSIGIVLHYDESPVSERRIDLSEFTPGIYLVRFTDEGIIRSKKLVISRSF